MSVLNAAMLLARRYPGGVAALAVRLQKSEHSLRHELTRSGFAKLGLEDAELLSLYALEARVDNPLAILNELATSLGAMVVPLPAMLADADGDTFHGLASAAREFSEFVATVADAAADGRVSANELAEVDRELSELIARAQSIRMRLAQLHEQGKPLDPSAPLVVPPAKAAAA